MRIHEILIVSVSLALWGCGSDSENGGDAQSELADLLLAEDVQGADESCVREKTADLSGDDAQFLIDNIDATDIEGFSAEQQAWVESLLECIDLEAQLDEESVSSEDSDSSGAAATETTISDDEIEASTETVPVTDSTAAPAASSSVEVIESTKSLPVNVDVGGTSPTDPREVELQQELDSYFSANGIPTDQAEMFAYFGADRWAHLFIENATIRNLSTNWSLEEDGAGDVAVNISYRLDRSGLDEAAVADAIESAMTEAGLERTLRQDIEEGVSSDVRLQFGLNDEDHFTVRVLGPDDDVPDPTALVIMTTARFADVVPQLFAAVAPIGPTLDQIDPDGPIIQIEVNADNNPFPYIVREIERLTTVDPAEFDAYVPILDAASAEIYGTDRLQEKIEDDLARFQYRWSRVEASIEDEGVVLLLADGLHSD